MDDAARRSLLDAVRSRSARIVDLTIALMECPTENPPGTAYFECAGKIADAIRDAGLEPRVVDLSDRSSPSTGDGRRAAILATTPGDGGVLWFHGHYDVVPACRGEQLRPARDESTITGRGSSDMKGGVAAMIHAAAALAESGALTRGRVGLCLVPDEETGGARGARRLTEMGLLGLDGIGMLTAEPTGGVVWSGNRGAITLRIAIGGRPAHVGLHYKGLNAFERMLDVAARLRELKAEVEARQTRHAIEPEAARASILMMGGRCEGGDGFNVVPASCAFTVDRRINPEEDLDAERQRLLDLLEEQKARGIDLSVEILQEGRSSFSPDTTPLARALGAVLEEATGKAPRFEICPGLLETRFYAARGIPAYAWGPGLLSVSHGPDEFVKIADLHRAAAVYALTAARFLSANGSRP